MGRSQDGEGRPGDTMRGRVPGSSAKLWLLMGASRWAVAAILLGLTFAVLVVLGALDPAGLSGSVESKDPIETLGQAFLTAIITGVTLVVTINQVVLSQELGAVGDQRERMAGAMQFREDVAEATEASVAPPEPSAFLRALVDAASARAEALAEAVRDGDAELQERVEQYVEGIQRNAESVTDQLEGAQFGTFEVLFAALNFNYSWKLYEARRLGNAHAAELPEAAADELDRLVETLELFGPAREHFKTLYFQWELINLSRAMLYAAVPALLVSMGMILYLDNLGTVVGGTLGVHNLVWVVAAASTVALLPFVLLLSYVLRIATVAKRTLAIGPFVLRETDRTDDIEWDSGD
jgi:hypothetical protein